MSGGAAGGFPGGTPAGRTGLFDELVGVDPSVAPGLNRPIGWRALLGDGTAAWFKTGAADTAWTQIIPGGAFPGYGGAPPAVAAASAAGVAATVSRSDHTHQGVKTVASGDTRLGVTTAAAIATLTQTIIANWTRTICRVYAVDGVNGNDANLGYVDPASSSAADYATACAAAGAPGVALKTLAGLGAKLPKIGAGRLVEIVVAAGTYADAIDAALGGVSGYATNSTLRGTATNTTAGVTAFDGSAADCTYAGCTTVAGLNAAGYNPDAATSAVLTLTKVGGGAPALPAEPNKPLMCCLRFDVATTTAALRNKCYLVLAVPTAATVQLEQSITRVATDVCYLEDGAVVIPGGNLGDNAMLGNANFFGFAFVGVRFSATLRPRGGRWLFQKCSGTSFSTPDGNAFITVGPNQSASYPHPVRGSLVVGGGLALTTGISAQPSAVLKLYGFTQTSTFQTSSAASITMISCCLPGLQWQGAINADSNNPIGCGTPTTALQPLRIISPVASRGGIDVENGILCINGVDIQNSGALPAIALHAAGTNLVMGSDHHGAVSGATGNNDVGLDLALAYGCTVGWTVRPTVTGALGDVRLGDGTITTWAALAAAITTVDTHGNRLSGV